MVRSFAVSLAATLILAAPAGAAVVGPGDSIQAAVDAAAPGDTIPVYGTHRENVAIQKDRLTLRGVGAVILPPADPAPNACFDPTVAGEALHGICVIGDVDFDTGEISRYVQDVTISGFTIRGFAGAGIVATAAAGSVVKRNVATGNRDAGINAVQALDTRIRSNRASGGRFGVLVTGSAGGAVAANALHDNCVGALMFAGAAGFRITSNAVRHNNRVCEPVAGEWPALSGAGVLVVAASANTIAANLITRNAPAGETAFSGGVAVASIPEADPSSDNIVRGNVVLRNDPDLFWDEAGAGNVFRDNVCRTSIPPDLCG